MLSKCCLYDVPETPLKITGNESGVVFTSGSTGIPATVSGSTISGSALHIEGSGKITGDLTLGGQITMGDADSDDIVFAKDIHSAYFFLFFFN